MLIVSGNYILVTHHNELRICLPWTAHLLNDIADNSTINHIMNTVLTDSTAVVNTPSDLDLDTKRAVGSFMTHLADAKLPAISRVLLYGSRARGDYQADSDVDIAVVLAGGNPGGDVRYDLQMLLSEVRSRAMLHTNMPVSAIVIWDAELREPDKQRNPTFYRNVRVDGIDIRAPQ